MLSESQKMNAKIQPTPAPNVTVMLSQFA